jgi:hypothetical protein
MQEAGIPSKNDIAFIERRKQIRNSIQNGSFTFVLLSVFYYIQNIQFFFVYFSLSGDVKTAVEILNDLDPEVLL